MNRNRKNIQQTNRPVQDRTSCFVLSGLPVYAAIIRYLSSIIFLSFCIFASQSASAKEPYQKFLKALQESGMSDVALEYIDHIEKRSDLPADIRETLDLERSNSLRMAAQNAYDTRQAERYLADAQKYLDKFLKDHPDHPSTGSSILLWGDALFELGQRSLAAAKKAAEPPQKTKLFAEAREYFTQAGDRYSDAEKRFLARYRLLQPDETKTIGKIESKNDPLAVERQAMENGLVQARFSLGRVEYHLAQTYEDPKSSERIDLLKAAEKSFGDIYQQYRQSTEDERCIVALLWQGQTLVDLGEEQTAMEVFDEVLVRDTDGSDSALAPIFAQATLSRYTAMRKLGKLDEMVAEAAKWVELHKGWTKYPAFNAVVLDLGKAYQAQAEREVADKQKKILQKAAILLADFSKNDNPYKPEMLLLRRDILKQLGTEGVGAAEFLALGDAALQENRIDEARKDFEQARQKSLDAKDPKGVEDAKRAMFRADLRDAQNLFEKKKFEDSLHAAQTLAEGDVADPTTIGAAELALRSAFFLGATSENKEDAYSQLEKTADFVKTKWPGRPVADVARMILAQSQLQKGDAKAALALFAQVKPESSRYPWALFNIAKIHWYSYLEEKRKSDGRDDKLMAESEAKARDSLQKCVDLLQKTLGPGRKLAGDDTEDPAEEAKALQLIADAQLLQGEIWIEAKEYQKAADLLEPLLERAKTVSPESSDVSTTIYMAAIRARLGVEDAEKAADHAISMLAISEDNAKANSKLVAIARLLNEKLKSAEAAVIEAGSGDPQNLEAATAKRDAFKEQFRKLIEPLGKRKEHSLPDLVFLGGVCFTLNLTDEGGQIYQNLLDRAKEDPAFAQKSEKALVYARSQLIGVLRSQGKLDEALKQADELIKKNPRVLAPKMTRADILEDLAKKDPKKLDEAIAQWSEIRVLLTRDNPKRPEYFEVIYKISKSLYQQYVDSKDKSKLAPAEQLLQTTLVQYAKLSGPDMVAKYNDLLKKIQDAKGKK